MDGWMGLCYIIVMYVSLFCLYNMLLYYGLVLGDYRILHTVYCVSTGESGVV